MGATFAPRTAHAATRALPENGLSIDWLADQRNEDDGAQRQRQPARAPPDGGIRTGGRLHAERDRGRAARVAPAEVVQRLGRPLVGHERAQARLAPRAPAQVELRRAARSARG